MPQHVFPLRLHLYLFFLRERIEAYEEKRIYAR